MNTIFLLLLNDMRSNRFEVLQPISAAPSKEALIQLMERERVIPYQDGRWGKHFRIGGPLEWCNAGSFSIFEIPFMDET